MRHCLYPVAAALLALATPALGAPEGVRSLDAKFATQAAMRTAIESEAVAWLKESAHPFDPAALDQAALAPLVAAVAGARVVGIGEVTHGTHEDSAFKAALVGAMVARGDIAQVVFELNRATGERLQAFIAPGSTETDPDRAMREGKVYQVWMTRDFANLLLALQAWNRTAAPPVRVSGVDVQDTGRDARVALDALALRDPVRAAALQARLAPLLSDAALSRHMVHAVQAMSHAQWQEALAAARQLEAASALPAGANGQAGDAAAMRALAAAGAARAGLEMFEFDANGADAAAMPRDYYGLRDRAMADRLLASLHKGERAVLWAHDSHVARRGTPAGFEGTSIGTRLNDVLGPGGYAAINFSYADAGLHAIGIAAGDKAPSAGQTRPDVWTLHAAPGSLGEFAARTGLPAYWVDLRTLPRERWTGGFLSLPYARLGFGWGFSDDNFSPFDFPEPIGYAFDILVHIARMTPSERIAK
jgi:erythromycin esterase